MNTKTLFKMQKELDGHIESKHGLENEDLFDRKVLALLVEIGELANETRCFKFWSLKPSSEKDVIVEEFVDGIHFILSLGIECGFENLDEIPSSAVSEGDTSSQFLKVYENVQKFRSSRAEDDYVHLFKSYMDLANLLGLTEDDMEQAYIKKNEVNYDRQRKGY
ncbi:dUTP diphosphatase [Mesobacillus subterraneus]|uniref:dUTPase n=1 Tax=Mesobacillus subterraneus TaxID=285983 RepID=A0A3R9ED53_9BACI|nr:dUTP diphosphatase [Mesobacillus subterraneus]RSD27669.1 dUTPase [Mesobacillus subterraneus]